MRTTVPVIHEDTVSWFGLTYRIPHIEYGEAITASQLTLEAP